MFTLKLYRRRPVDATPSTLLTQITSVHHILVQAFNDGKTLCLYAFRNEHDYDEVYVGERAANMNALTDDNHWQWGLLENWEGNTTQHFRPASFG